VRRIPVTEQWIRSAVEPLATRKST
jgi:hypothetical protein